MVNKVYDSPSSNTVKTMPALSPEYHGPPGPKGDTGNIGPRGLIGPKGVKGDPGDPGPMGPQGVRGEPGEFGPQGAEGAAGSVGPFGPPGPQGIDGPQGALGPGMYSGADDPLPVQHRIDDLYLNTVTGDLYTKNNTLTWTLIGILMGPTGDSGPQGPPGSTAPIVRQVDFADQLTLDWSGISVYRVTLTADCEITNSNAIDGQIMTLLIEQDATGGHAVTWGSETTFSSAGSVAVTQTPAARDRFILMYDAATQKYDVVVVALGL